MGIYYRKIKIKIVQFRKTLIMNKYNLNDEVFTIDKNVVCKFKIKEMGIKEFNGKELIYYKDLFADIVREEKYCFRTKEELLASL